MDLEEPSIEFPKAPDDKRLRMPEPPPVRLVAVEDVTLESSAQDAGKLDAFYVDLLRFERDAKAGGVVYKAENVWLKFKVMETPLIRDDMRAIGVEVPSLADLELMLVERQIVYLKEKALTLGHVTFLLRDPAGNWLRIGQVKRIL
jgi:hypothetical protein